MKRFLAGVLVVIGLLSLLASAQNGSVKVQVPFNFFIGGTNYDAGTYNFSVTRDTVVISDTQNNPLARTLANNVSSTHPDSAQIVFNCYAKQCFLYQVFSPGQDRGRQLLPSRMETEVATRQPRTYMALRQSGRTLPGR